MTTPCPIKPVSEVRRRAGSFAGRSGTSAYLRDRLGVGLLVLLLLAIGCDAHHKTTPDPNSRNTAEVDLLHDPAFAFRFGDGSGLDGYDVLTVNAAGHCTYLFHPNKSERLWRHADFDCDSATMSDLRRLLQQVKVTELPKDFIDTHTVDGTARFLNVSLTGYKKSIYWSNYFPDPFERIQKFVQGKILGPHAAAISSAPTTMPTTAEMLEE